MNASCRPAEHLSCSRAGGWLSTKLTIGRSNTVGPDDCHRLGGRPGLLVPGEVAENPCREGLGLDQSAGVNCDDDTTCHDDLVERDFTA